MKQISETEIDWSNALLLGPKLTEKPKEIGMYLFVGKFVKGSEKDEIGIFHQMGGGMAFIGGSFDFDLDLEGVYMKILEFVKKDTK